MILRLRYRTQFSKLHENFLTLFQAYNCLKQLLNIPTLQYFFYQELKTIFMGFCRKLPGVGKEVKIIPGGILSGVGAFKKLHLECFYQEFYF